MKEERKKVLKTAENLGVRFVQLQFMDIVGTVKNITIPVSKLEKAMEEGIFFDGSSIFGYPTVEESDMRLVPDLRTFAVLSWTKGELKTGRMICDVYDHRNNRFEGDPRYALQRVLDKARKMGYIFYTAPEYEFFLLVLDEKGNPITKPSDFGGYFDLTRDRGDEIRKEVVSHLNAMGFEIEASHHEVAPGQHEIDFRYCDALTSADRVVTTKYAIKVIAHKHGLFATFMPKPIYGVNGSGMHTHMSLMTPEGKNVFHDPKGEYQLSKTALHFIGGLLKYAKEMCAILAPSVNSYKRLVPGYGAPVYVSWANRNRSAYIRVPSGRGDRTRIELRSPDPAGNPYLQFTVMLAAGLRGIKERLSPPEPVEKNIFRMSEEERKALRAYPLPKSLGEALDHMRESALIREALGEFLFEHFLYIKEKEWEVYRGQVTDWEITNLLPSL